MAHTDGTVLSSSTGSSGEISSRLDRLGFTSLHLLIIVVGTLGFAFDLMEVALGNVLSAVFSAPPYSTDSTQLSWLLASMYVGAIVGAPAAGWLADLYGRRVVLSGVLLALTATSIGAALSVDFGWLIVARTLSGLALGAYPPLIISYLTDLFPGRLRSRLIMLVAGLAALGPVAIVFLVRWLTPIAPFGMEAWRWAFVVGAVGAAFVAVALFALPESPRWLKSRGRHSEAEEAIKRFEGSHRFSPDSDPALDHRRAQEAATERSQVASKLAVFSALNFFAPWSVVAFPLLMGAVLVEKGFALLDSLFYVGITLFGPVVGTIAAGFLLDNWKRKSALATLGLTMIAATVAFAASPEPLWLTVAGLAFTITGQLYVPTLTIFTAESFATAVRARTGALAWAVNRLASALAPLVLLPLMRGIGIWAMFSVMVVALVLGIAVALAFSPNTRPGDTVD